MITVPDSRHLGILDLRDKSKGQFGDREIGWIVSACNQFLREELRKLYPDEPIWTVEYYTSITKIDLAVVWPMVLMDDDGLADALGHHYVRWGLIGAAVDCLGRTLDAIMKTVLHELEMCFNPYLIEWVKLPDGRETPREAGDPPQWIPYVFEVSQTFGGVTKSRDFTVQNMVGARYWDPTANGDFDITGNVIAAHQWPIGGYRVIRDNGRRYNEFGQGAEGQSFGARKFGPGSRTWALTRKGETPTVAKDGKGSYPFTAQLGTLKFSGQSAKEALDLCRRSLIQK